MSHQSAEEHPPTLWQRVRPFMLVLVAVVLLGWYQRPDGRLHVYFPAVPGDAALVQTPGGAYVLIDGGADPAALAVALGRIMPFWQRDLALVVLTIPDSQRLPGQIAALQRYHIGKALVHPVALKARTAEQREWQRLLRQQGVQLLPASLKQPVVLGNGLRLRTLALGDGKKYGLLLRLEYGSTSVLLAHAADPTSSAIPAQLVTFPWAYDPHAALVEESSARWLLFSDGSRAKPAARLDYTERAIGGATLYHEALDGMVVWTSTGRRSWVETQGP